MLEEPAFEIVRNTGIEHFLETAHDVYVVVPLALRCFSQKDPGFFTRQLFECALRGLVSSAPLHFA